MNRDSMSKPLIKGRLLLRGNKHLVDLLLLRLHDGSLSLKLSFKNPVGNTKVWARQTKHIADTDFSNPAVEKITPCGESFDVSYNFKKNQLEVKQEGSRFIGGIERRHYNVSLPVNRFLFTLYLNHMNELESVESTEEDLIFDNENLDDSIVAVFSFTDANGDAFMDPNVNFSKRGRRIDLDIGIPQHEILRVAILPNELPIPGQNNFLLTVPHEEIKH